MRRIYVDNAATSFPKPESVYAAIEDYMRNCGASAGRGCYREAFDIGDRIQETREALARLLNSRRPERILFTLNATDALNLAIKGVVKKGDHVVTTAMDHNSVLRPLNALEAAGLIEYTRVACRETGELEPERIEQALRSHTKLIALTHASNVCGTLLPIEPVAEIARRHRVLLLVDAAQTAGSYPIDLSRARIDLLAFPGHKGLFGPLGTGALCVGDDVDLTPLREGGTGSVSERDVQPDYLPDRYESGSHNALGIVGLLAGVRFLLEIGVGQIRAHKKALTASFLSRASSLDNVRVHGPTDADRNAGVVSVSVRGRMPHEVSSQLDERFRVQTRPGLHCAPWAHRTLGTYPEGTVRFSFSYLNTEQDVQEAVEALRRVATP